MRRPRAGTPPPRRSPPDSRLAPADLVHGISLVNQLALDRALRSGPARQHISRIKVWDPSGVVVYSDDHRLTGRRFPLSEELAKALGGQVFSQVSTPDKVENVDERRLGQVLEVYTPLRLSPAGPLCGAFEIYVPYARVAAAISSDGHMIFYMAIDAPRCVDVLDLAGRCQSVWRRDQPLSSRQLPGRGAALARNGSSFGEGEPATLPASDPRAWQPQAQRPAAFAGYFC